MNFRYLEDRVLTQTKLYQETSRLLYSSFHPFPKWVEDINKKGPNTLSYVVTALILLAIIVNAFTPSLFTKVMVEMVWVGFEVWVTLFFAYLIFHFIFEWRKARLFREHHPEHARKMN